MTKKQPKDLMEFFRQTSRTGGKIGGQLSLLTIGARMECASTAEDRSERANKAAAASAEARKKGDRQRLPAAGPTLQASPVPTSKPQTPILNRLLG